MKNFFILKFSLKNVFNFNKIMESVKKVCLECKGEVDREGKSVDEKVNFIFLINFSMIHIIHQMLQLMLSF